MYRQEIIRDITQRLQVIDGIIGVVLGGSRASGTHMPDSDIDLGIYYEPDSPPDIAASEPSCYRNRRREAYRPHHAPRWLGTVDQWGWLAHGAGPFR